MGAVVILAAVVVVLAASWPARLPMASSPPSEPAPWAAQPHLADHLAAARMALAQRAWQAGDMAAAQAVLTMTDPARRGWDNDYLERLCHHSYRTLGPDRPGGLAYHPDGVHVAIGDVVARVIRLYDSTSGREVAIYEAGGPEPCHLAFSPDGESLAVAGRDRIVRVLDVETGRERASVPEPFEIAALAFAPNSQRLAVLAFTAGVTIRVSDTGQVVNMIADAGLAHGLAFSPDGRLLAVGRADGPISLIDVERGKVVRTLPAQIEPTTGRAVPARALAFHPRQPHLTVGYADGGVTIWAAASGQRVMSLMAHQGAIHGLAFDKTGRQLATAGADRQVHIWETETGRRLDTLRGSRTAVTTFAFRSDGRQVVAIGAEPRARLWDLPAAQEARVIPTPLQVPTGLGFSPDGQAVVLVGADRTCQAWEIETGQPLSLEATPPPLVTSVVSADSRRTATITSEGGVHLIDTATGLERLSLPCPAGPIVGLAWAPDGGLLTGVTVDGLIVIWDGRPLTEK
jgi:WD40 repeat protein